MASPVYSLLTSWLHDAGWRGGGCLRSVARGNRMARLSVRSLDLFYPALIGLMDGNKDESLRSIKLAKSAFASGDRQRAEKLVRIAQRLDPSVPLDDLLSPAEKVGILNSATFQDKTGRGQACVDPETSKQSVGPFTVDQGYSEENIRVVQDIRKKKDYYAVLGVERRCSAEEIRKAYRRLSLKVHPDKNKAPGAEDAFKLVSKAFKCLSNDQSRRTYDQTGTIEDHEFNEQHPNATRRGAASRRRPARSGFYSYEEDFDPDEIFRSFFYGTHDNMFRTQNVYRARGTGRQHQQRREHSTQGGSGINLTVLVHLAVVLFIVLLAFIPVRRPEYSLQKTYYFPISKVTQKHGVEFFVSKQDFDQQFPQGSQSRENLEQHVLKDFKSLLGRYCHVELQRRQWAKDYPTPHCDKLRSLSVA